MGNSEFWTRIEVVSGIVIAAIGGVDRIKLVDKM